MSARRRAPEQRAPRGVAGLGGAGRRGAPGFTLIELLVALTLFGLISVVVMGGLRFGTRVWETGEARAEAVAEIEAVQSLLRRYLSQAIVPQPFGRRPEDSPLFIGDPDRLRFVTVSPAHLGVGGLYEVEIWRAEPGVGDNGTLELAWHVFRPEDPSAIERLSKEDEDTLAGGRRTLLTGVKAVSFSYLDSEAPAVGDPEWESTWGETDILPALIALKVEFAEDAKRFWPDLVVQARLAHARR